uniref:Uncharacterized protein n=1 Tax=Anguilla anguilla TaxID=7936 RepID=A0A0E9R9H0_ANGAN
MKYSGLHHSAIRIPIMNPISESLSFPLAILIQNRLGLLSIFIHVTECDMMSVA